MKMKKILGSGVEGITPISHFLRATYVGKKNNNSYSY